MTYKIDPGAQVRVGVPARPDPSFARTLAEVLVRFSEIREAHLPMCFVEGKMPIPALVLVVVFDDAVDQVTLLAAIHEKIASVLPYGAHVDVWPLASDSTLTDAVRAARCRILRRTSSGAPKIDQPFSKWKMLQRRLDR